MKSIRQKLNRLAERQRMPLTAHTSTRILFEDSHLLVVDKPSGFLAQPVDDGTTPNLADATKQFLIQRNRLKGNAYVGMVQRLDAAVSGAMVMCKTSKSAARMAQKFANRQVVKDYFAVVHGEVHGRGIIEGGSSFEAHWAERSFRKTQYVPAMLQPEDVQNNKKVDGPTEWLAVNQFVLPHRSLNDRVDPTCTLLCIRPSTGRKHQIRRQLADQGHPIVGDQLYGSPINFPHERMIMLHAVSLQFDHPVALPNTRTPQIPKGKFKKVHALAPIPNLWNNKCGDVEFPVLSSGVDCMDPDTYTNWK